jgi:hypothetical protein
MEMPHLGTGTRNRAPMPGAAFFSALTLVD